MASNWSTPCVSPYSIAHMRVGSITNARRTKITNVLKVTIDHSVPAFKSKCHFGHVVKQIAGETIYLKSMFTESVNNCLVT